MDYKEFKQYQLKLENDVFRLDDLNLYSLQSFFSKHINVTSETYNTKGGFYVKKSLGVRELLIELFQYFSEKGYQLNIPIDVYPEYFNLVAKNADIRVYNSYGKRQFSFSKENNLSLSLVTNPLIPEGRYLSKRELIALDSWLMENSNRWLIFDMVYDYKLRSLEFNFHSKNIIFINSLSKLNLTPKKLGWALSKTKLQGFKGSEKIMFNKELTVSIQKKYDEAWKSIDKKLELKQRFNWDIPQVGYLSVVNKSFDEFLEEFGIATIPASIFGIEKEDLSVLSCLSEFK